MKTVTITSEIKEKNPDRSTNTNPVVYKLILTCEGLYHEVEAIRQKLLNMGENNK